MGLRDLTDAGVPDILRDAVIILRERGHAKGATIDDAGAVDVHGAILLAAGGKHNRLYGFVTDPSEAGVPNYYHSRVLSAYEVLEGLVNADLHDWNDDPTTNLRLVEMTLRKAEDILRIAIT